ncbi:DSC E3 ubiquitin ligase complex subunit [Lachnellula occidentalis]|uniref:DSC E3 ubiquitin ligase complex subunit n=1 Tax=Lachnellula occidentalis TaxID=215460 RepID=A0A8H8S6Q4_9HELO|nr:DSC E3 ubiquitin ligase complex subunit [Lachnellula occidentalis]
MNNDEPLPPTDNLSPIDAAAPPLGQDAKLSPAQKRAREQTRKKLEFVGSLMQNLDVLIYVELCILYYMDCSLFRLLIRAVNQMMFLSPKPNFIPPMPQHRPYIGAIFGPNIICFLLHIFTARSEAGEAMRGYLHGGIIVDLIGQKGPTSKIHLVLLDVLVLVLQCFMLAVHIERERLVAVLKAFLSPNQVTDEPRSTVSANQDHDAEERGIMREAITNNGDIELQPLHVREDGPSTAIPSEHEEERARLLAEPPPLEEREEDALDMFWSGTAIVADFHVLQNIRTQWSDYGNATGSALQTAGFSAGFAAVAANRRLNAANLQLQRSLTA